MSDTDGRSRIETRVTLFSIDIGTRMTRCEVWYDTSEPREPNPYTGAEMMIHYTVAGKEVTREDYLALMRILLDTTTLQRVMEAERQRASGVIGRPF